MILLVSCGTAPEMIEASATETAICDAWLDSLPTRSRADTQDTINQIGVLYDTFLAACEGYKLPF